MLCAEKHGDSEMIALASDQKFMMVEALLLAKADPNETSRKVPHSLPALHSLQLFERCVEWNDSHPLRGQVQQPADGPRADQFQSRPRDP